MHESLEAFEEIWFVDFEFIAPPGFRPDPVRMWSWALTFADALLLMGADPQDAQLSVTL